MMKKSRYIMLIVCLFAVISFCGCGNKGNTDENGSTNFRNYAPSLSEDAGTQIYVHEGMDDYFGEKTAEKQMDANCFAVYANKIYYMDTQVGFETGSVSEENCKLLCRSLDEGDEKGKIVFELFGVTAIGNLVIQENVLYISWLTTKDEIKQMVLELETDTKTEISIPNTRNPEAFTSEGYYYIQGEEIYFCKWNEEIGEVFCKVEGEVRAVYKSADSLYVIVEDREGISMKQFEKNGKLQEHWQGLEQMETNFVGDDLRFVKAEGDILFYELSSGMNADGKNTFLVQMNLKTKEKEVLGGWYMP